MSYVKPIPITIAIPEIPYELPFTITPDQMPSFEEWEFDPNKIKTWVTEVIPMDADLPKNMPEEVTVKIRIEGRTIPVVMTKDELLAAPARR